MHLVLKLLGGENGGAAMISLKRSDCTGKSGCFIFPLFLNLSVYKELLHDHDLYTIFSLVHQALVASLAITSLDASRSDFMLESPTL